jgi:hypothetical protein
MSIQTRVRLLALRVRSLFFFDQVQPLLCIDKRMFLMAALQEISGKERELATDPDCAGGLERMAYSMDDYVRRVFMDSLTGS